MELDLRRVRKAIEAAGGNAAALHWPFNRNARARMLMRKRLAVLDAKNTVVDLLYRTQRPLADLHLFTSEHAERLLKHPERRKMIVGLSVSRQVIEDELRRSGAGELGPTLDRALSELIEEGVILELPGKAFASKENVYMVVFRGQQPHYDVAELRELVREDAEYGSRLRERMRRERTTTGGRSYRL